MVKPKITYYVDIASPFAYLAFHILRTSPVFEPCEITYVPVLLGGIVHACGNIPPISIKNKGEYVGKERLYFARAFKVPMADAIPEPFPVKTLAVQRVLTTLSLGPQDKFLEACGALYSHFFVERKGVEKPEDFLPVIEEALGKQEAQDVLKRSTMPEAKKLLIANTDQALRDGAFGLPYFVATTSDGERETFWGFDRVGQMCAFLGLERPAGETWKAML